jgi:tetratricopeptide (TPR) repeat protein
MREPVVVLPFVVRGSSSELQGLGVDVADRFAAALEGNNVAKAVAYGPESSAREFTRRLGARALKEAGGGTLITGVVARRGDAIEVEARLIRGSDLRIVWTLGPERGSAADPTAALDRLRERVLGAVYWYLSPQWGQRHEPTVYHPPPSLEVARMVEEAEARMWAFSPSQAFPRYREAAARDTTWLHPVVAMMWANNGRACYPWCSRVADRVGEVRDSLDAFLNARRDRLSQGDARFLDLLRARRASPGDEVEAMLALLAIDSFYVGQAMHTHFRTNRLNEALGYYERRDTMDTRGVLRDDIAADIYDQLGRYEDVLALARSTKARDGAFLQEVSALAAQGDIDEIERVIAQSHTLRGQADPIWLIGRAALELSIHGWEKESRVYAERVLAEMRQWPDSLDRAGMMYRRDALAILGRYEDAARSLEELGRRNPAEARASRIQAMPFRIAAGDTVGALALVDSIRTQPLTAFYPWSSKGAPLYFGAQILSLLGRKEQAVFMLREALNNGARIAEPPDYSPHMRLRWVWAPLRGYPPFEELVRPR